MIHMIIELLILSGILKKNRMNIIIKQKLKKGQLVEPEVLLVLIK